MREYIESSIKVAAQRKSRTLLTLVGITIGIAVIVAMVSIGEGMEYSINKQLQSFGANKITIMPSGMSFGAVMGTPTEYVSFTERELRELKSIPEVKSAVPGFYKAVRVKYRGEEKTLPLIGDTEKGLSLWKETGFYKISSGRFYREYEGSAVLLGHRVHKSVFSNEIMIGEHIAVNDKKFQVVGILQEYGDPAGDISVYMPISAARELFNAGDEITYIVAIAENEQIVERLGNSIEERLKKTRGGKDFEILTTKEMAEQIAQIAAITSFVLGSIASVSILVGGVIIMNTMLMGVMERTREIGVMKATGASNATILSMFLSEAALTGFVGGSFGILLGAAISKAIESVGRVYISATFTTLITYKLVLAALLFSTLVGVLSGIYPAYRAARLNPIEALRYE